MKTELLAPCGLYCGVCGVYMASREHLAVYIVAFAVFIWQVATIIKN